MRAWGLPTAVALACLAWLAALQLGGLSESVTTFVSDAGQLVAALFASAGCGVASSRSREKRRRAWAWLSAGTGSWAAGQAVWTFYEVVLGQAVPFPSVADVGFLAFPVIGGVGLLIWSGAQGHETLARGRDVMDGVIIAVSLLVLSWVTVMAPLIAASGAFTFSTALSMAYPLGDVVLGTLVLIALFRSQTQRKTLALLALGIGGFALADSLFVYLTSAGTYSSADFVSSSGWVLGFVLVAASGLSVAREEAPQVDNESRPWSARSWWWLVLPYLPLGGAGVALFLALLEGESSTLADLLLSVVLVGLVLSRQFVAMIDNHRLVVALADAGGQLEFQATHDALTGLPNRTLFAKRLDQALQASSSSVSVLYCDLDNFKPVNDELGHSVGDGLLQVVAERLTACVRAGDTVARLGGDEFAILLADCPDATEIADRVVASVRSRTTVGGHPVQMSISVGVAHHECAQPVVLHVAAGSDSVAATTSEVKVERQATATQLVYLADTAMYAAKNAGKGRVAVVPAGAVHAVG